MEARKVNYLNKKTRVQAALSSSSTKQQKYRKPQTIRMVRFPLLHFFIGYYRSAILWSSSNQECFMIIILRNRLKHTLTYREVISLDATTSSADGEDVVSIPKTNENFRLLYDTKGRFRLHSVRDEEAKFKLCKVRSVQFGQKGIPYLNTYDGRTIRYPDPLIKANDTIKLDLESNKIVDFIKFDVGNVVMVTGGRNRGRVGVIKNREKHKGSFETVHIQDALGHEFATRLGNVFTLGKGTKPWVSLPKGKGIKLSIIEEARKRLGCQSATTA
ncbi:40S ribosomal protein S4 [Datura stramonium]|uniref:40S ribosomal protein S4 n=1 Tax=Datura stramonium TaxID=4076 RepID=A0ABS8TC27_DATST|nr:40S ribosomal protein S4 [Datura stramonium]